MSIQTYNCPEDGEFDKLLRSVEFADTCPCPSCGRTSPHVFKAPAIIDIKRDWNEKANLWQHDPYTQAKAQLDNISRERQERYDEKPVKVTEPMLQLGARQIDAQKTRPSILQKYQRAARKKAHKVAKERQLQ